MKIVFTGGESTAKTTISELLAREFSFPHVSEFEREYVEQLGRPYTYKDVLIIAEEQRKIEQKWANSASPVLFDTDMLSIQIWFQIYNWQPPNWLSDYMQQHKADLYLLMKPDIAWQPDPIRQYQYQGDFYFSFYENELQKLNANYAVISGIGEKRIENAKSAIKNVLQR